MWNLFCFLLSLYRLIINESEKNINKIKINASKCGPFAIKLLQFLCMNNIIKTKSLEYLLENCEIHPFNETEKMYFQDFGNDISEDYDTFLPTLIGSGSIGQVYCLYNRTLNKFVAMKVKHPCINKKVKKFNLIKTLIKIINPFISFGDIILQYIDNINLQLDYQLEVKNTKLLKLKFQNESSVIIPEIYEYTENFIIMSYHDGISFNQITDTPLKIKISLYINFIILSSLLVYDIFHGDLHFGNWKIQIEESGNSENPDIKIVLYDCGIVYSSNNLEFNKNMVKYIGCNDYESLLKTISNDNHLIKKVIKSLNDGPTSTRVKCFITESVKYKLLTDKNAINLLNSYAIICETLFIGIEKFNKFVFIKDDNAVLFYMYHELLNNLSKFNDLNIFIKDWMDSDPVNKTTLNSWMLSEFGHTNSKIVGKIIFENIF
jgi:predicted unusual protein kinase regulating ubiquinone biosynthesis (AarF/ABC1/UbiB family)